MADAPIIGPWTVRPHMTHSGQAGFKLTRRHSGAFGGQQDLNTPTLHIKRFKDRAKAEAHAAKLNAVNGAFPQAAADSAATQVSSEPTTEGREQ